MLTNSNSNYQFKFVQFGFFSISEKKVLCKLQEKMAYIFFYNKIRENTVF